MNGGFIYKNKRKLSLLLIMCMVLFHLPLNQVYAAPDPKPETGSIYVDGVDLLSDNPYPSGISYSYEGNVNIITVSGAAITLGHSGENNKYAGIFADGAGDVELVLVGNNTITISNDTEPEKPGERVGIFTGGGNLTFSGTGSLTINSSGRSIHMDAYGDPSKSVTFMGSVTVTTTNMIFTEGGDGDRPNVNINENADVTCHGIDCGNGNQPIVAEGASFTDNSVGGEPGGDPGQQSLYVNGYDILSDEYAGNVSGLSYEFDLEKNTHVITLEGVEIENGHSTPGNIIGICAADIGDVEIRLIGNNSITIPNGEDPEAEPSVINGIGIFVRGGSLTISGDGTLDIDTGDRAIVLDAHGAAEPLAITFKDSVVVEANKSIFTEGGDEDRPYVYINDTANVICHGIECGNDNQPIVDEAGGASFTDNSVGGDPGGGEPGGDPGQQSLYVNGYDILSDEYAGNVSGLSYEFDLEKNTHVITLEGVEIENGHSTPGNIIGICAADIGDVEIRLIGNNSITIPNGEDPEAEPSVINGIGIFVRGGSLTISGDGTLDIDTGDRAIVLDAHGAAEPLAITFKDSVVVEANKSIFTEGGDEDRPYVYINDTANVICHGIECGNGNQPIVNEAGGANFTNNDAGGDPGGPVEGILQTDGLFNLSVGGVDLIVDGVVQNEDIENVDIVYYEHVDQYSLYLKGGIVGGIYTSGNALFGIYVEEDTVVEKLDMPELVDYSIALSFGAEITPHDSLKGDEADQEMIRDNTLTLKGGILSNNRLSFKDDITVNIGSDDERASKGIVGDRNLNVNAVNPRSINIWADTVGVENVNARDGFKLSESAQLNINSAGTGASDTHFLVGEGAILDMTYIDKGNFTSAAFKWDYLDMTGPIETYINMPYTTVTDLSQGEHPEDKYSLAETDTAYYLASTANRLYTLGYNYDNDRDGVVDNPEEEIRNGRLSIKGATGICSGSLNDIEDDNIFIDYRFEAGSVVTIEMLPDYGYQYEAGTLSYNLSPEGRIDTTPGETRAYYTFIMPDGHVHLYAGFIPSSDIIKTNTDAITDANVDIGQNNINGNVEFVVDEYTPVSEEIDTVTELAGDMETGAFLDLNISEYIEKAGTDDAWVTELNELDNPVEINLELSDNLKGKSNYKVIRIHNGVAEVLDASYSNGKLTFETDKFSAYVIVYDDSPAVPTPTPPAQNIIATPTPTPIITPEPEEKPEFNINIIKSSQAEGDGDEEDDDMIISSDIIKQAIEAGEDVTVTVRDEDDNELYTWTFDTGGATGSLIDVNLSIDVQSLDDNEEVDDNIQETLADNQGLIISFGHSGDLPAAATVRIYVGNIDGIEPGMQIYLYHYNKETGKLETLPYSSRYTVDEDGYITINLVHCSDYVVLKNEAKPEQITSLRNQINVTVLSNKLYIGGTREDTTDIRIKLPATLMLVEDLNKAAYSKAVGGVTASFSSSNEKVAIVDKDGVITAVGEGKAVITASLKLYSGKVKTVKFNIEVEKAYVEFRKTKSVMEADSSYTFKAKGYGFYSRNIVWSSDDDSVITIDKTTGKAVAKSKGTAYITAEAKGTKNKIKVTVK